MQQPGAVDGGERGADIQADERGFAGAERPAGSHDLLERLAPHQLHPQADALVVLLRAVHLHHVRVTHPRQPPGLLEDATCAPRVIALVVQQLERDVTVEIGIQGTVDVAGRAVPDPIEEQQPAPVRPGRAARAVDRCRRR